MYPSIQAWISKANAATPVCATATRSRAPHTAPPLRACRLFSGRPSSCASRAGSARVTAPAVLWRTTSNAATRCATPAERGPPCSTPMHLAGRTHTRKCGVRRAAWRPGVRLTTCALQRHEGNQPCPPMACKRDLQRKTVDSELIADATKEPARRDWASGARPAALHFKLVHGCRWAGRQGASRRTAASCGSPNGSVSAVPTGAGSRGSASARAGSSGDVAWLQRRQHSTLPCACKPSERLCKGARRVAWVYACSAVARTAAEGELRGRAMLP
jgi:hypothetical protein